MAELRTNKPDAARRQLDAAIRMLFSKEDALAVHIVASAASRILRDLAEKSGKSKFHEHLKSLIQPGMEKQFWTAMNKSASFLKHADKDPDDLLEGVQEEANDMTILCACMNYGCLGFQLTPTMQGFMMWSMVMNPKLLKETAPERAIIDGGLDFEHIRSQPRTVQLDMGNAYITMMIRRAQN